MKKGGVELGTRGKKRQWTGSQWRCYKKVYYGIVSHWNQPIRIMSLGSPDVWHTGRTIDIDKGFHKLTTYVRRKTPKVFVDNGFVDPGKVSYYFPDLGYDEELDFEYVKIRTDEGPNGVIHCVWHGSYVPQNWLYDTWKGILNVDQLANQSADVRKISDIDNSHRRVSAYVVNQYVADQPGFLRYSCSKNWIYPGFDEDYKIIRAWFFDYENPKIFYDELSNHLKLYVTEGKEDDLIGRLSSMR